MNILVYTCSSDENNIIVKNSFQADTLFESRINDPVNKVMSCVFHIFCKSTLCVIFHRYPSKHETLTQCWFNAGPPSATLDQHWTSSGRAFRVVRRDGKCSTGLQSQKAVSASDFTSKQILLFRLCRAEYVYYLWCGTQRRRQTAVTAYLKSKPLLLFFSEKAKTAKIW